MMHKNLILSWFFVIFVLGELDGKTIDHAATLEVLNDLEIAVYGGVPLSEEGKASLLKETFNKLDVDGNGFLSSEEQKAIHLEIFTSLAQFYTEEGSDKITKQTFADHFITFEVPDELEMTEDVCNYEAMTTVVGSEMAWNEIVGSDREWTTTAQLGAYLSQQMPEKDWTFEDYTNHVANEEVKDMILDLKQSSNKEHFSLVKFDDIHEQKHGALCNPARRQLFIGGIFQTVLGSFAGSAFSNGVVCLFSGCTWGEYWRNVAIGTALGTVWSGFAATASYIWNYVKAGATLLSQIAGGRRQLELPQLHPQMPSQRLLALEKEYYRD